MCEPDVPRSGERLGRLRRGNPSEFRLPKWAVLRSEFRGRPAGHQTRWILPVDDSRGAALACLDRPPSRRLPFGLSEDNANLMANRDVFQRPIRPAVRAAVVLGLDDDGPQLAELALEVEQVP